MEKKWIIIGLVIMAIAFTSFGNKKESELGFLWNGLQAKAVSSSDFVMMHNDGYEGGASSNCAIWEGFLTPMADTDGAIAMHAHNVWSSCTGGTGSIEVSISLPKPKEYYESVAVSSSGSVEAAGSDTMNCASATGSAKISQLDNSNNGAIFGTTQNCKYSSNLPSGVTMTFSGNNVVISSSGVIYPLLNNNDLVLTYLASTSNCCTGRSAEADINLNGISVIYKHKFVEDTKTTFISGGDFNTFVANANRWAKY